MRLGLLLALLLLVAACGGGGDEPTVDEIVEAAAQAAPTLESFHFQLGVSNPASSPDREGLALSAAEGDVVVPRRLRADFQGTYRGLSVDSQIVLIGSRLFLELPGERWRELGQTVNLVELFRPGRGVPAVLRSATRLERLDAEEVDGTETHHLRGLVPGRELGAFFPGAPPAGRRELEVWIGKEDSVVRRASLTDPSSAATYTIEISQLGEPVRIERPSVTP